MVRNFAKAEGKLHLERAADTVAERLVDLGVEIYGDLRFATYPTYGGECGVRPAEVGRLVARFAPPEKVEKVTTALGGVAQAVHARM